MSKDIIPLSYIKDIPYYLKGTILYTHELDVTKLRPFCIPFGQYKIDTNQIILYKGWKEKIDTYLNIEK